MNPTKLQAIQTALQGDWGKAVLLNQELLKERPDDVDALNRLGFALASLGEVKQAKHTYLKVLSLDSQNPIALKNLKRLTNSNVSKTKNITTALMNNIFIEEPGKTKVIDLINVAEQKVIGELRCGEFLSIEVKRMKIFLLDGQKQYIGMLPDDMSKRIIRFIKGGNIYGAYVKTINNHKVTVFIREVKRATRFKHQPSFIQSEKSKLLLDSGVKKYAKDNKQKTLETDDEERGSYPPEEDESL